MTRPVSNMRFRAIINLVILTCDAIFIKNKCDAPFRVRAREREKNSEKLSRKNRFFLANTIFLQKLYVYVNECVTRFKLFLWAILYWFKY